MEWKDLSTAAKSVLERCWGITHDNPTTYSIELGKVLFKNEVTVDTFQEIMRYQKHFPYFDAKLERDVITVRGNCEFGSWKEDV